MRPRGPVRFALVTAALAAQGWLGQASEGSDHPDVTSVVAHVAERVSAYYQRAQQLICVERSTVVPIDSSQMVQGFGRTVESELRVELEAGDGDALPDARITRQVRLVNGRAPRERDKKDRSGCTDPTPISPEPLAFLLPGHREGYRFTAVHNGHERDRAALVIDFSSAERSSHPELIEAENGRDDCFDWKGSIAIAGQLWVDAATYDVLRLERRILGPTDVRVPPPLQRKYRFDPWVTLDRDDLSVRYKAVAFTEPTETVLLPASTESTTVIRSGLQSMRRVETFSDYRRFLTDTRIIKVR